MAHLSKEVADMYTKSLTTDTGDIMYATTQEFGSSYVYKDYEPERADPVIWKCKSCGTAHNIIGMTSLSCKNCGSPLSDPEDDIVRTSAAWDHYEYQPPGEKPRRWWQFWRWISG
jgi:ribosomal protein L37AE/L43A